MSVYFVENTGVAALLSPFVAEDHLPADELFEAFKREESRPRKKCESPRTSARSRLSPFSVARKQQLQLEIQKSLVRTQFSLDRSLSFRIRDFQRTFQQRLPAASGMRTRAEARLRRDSLTQLGTSLRRPLCSLPHSSTKAGLKTETEHKVDSKRDTNQTN